jgi:hypothetical protein
MANSIQVRASPEFMQELKRYYDKFEKMYGMKVSQREITRMVAKIMRERESEMLDGFKTK